MTAREAEIIRLGREAGQNRNVDELALQHRCEGQESLILQLTEQVSPLYCRQLSLSGLGHASI